MDATPAPTNGQPLPLLIVPATGLSVAAAPGFGGALLCLTNPAVSCQIGLDETQVEKLVDELRACIGKKTVRLADGRDLAALGKTNRWERP